MRIHTSISGKHTITDIADCLFHVCIALISVLYVVKVPVLNMSLGTIIILAYVPRSLWTALKRINIQKNIKAWLFFMFYAYLICRSDGNALRIVLCCSAFIIQLGIMKGSVDIRRLRKIIEWFALLNVALLVLQVLAYYGLHVKIQYIPQKLIYEEYQNSWVFRDEAGLFRPSALFLEPSHFSQFCLFALISCLFPTNGNPKIKKALAIGMGCILTTSGMGIILTGCIFSWFLVLNKEKLNKKMLRVLIMIPIALLVLLVLLQTAFFQTALQRVFSSSDGYNAVSGRTHNWDDAVGSMRGVSLWFGYGDSKQYSLYLTGLADSIYKYGIICVVLEGLCLLYLVVKKPSNFVCLCCIIFATLFCVAHVTNFVAQIFYFGIVIADANLRNKKQDDSDFLTA